ncbi:hypothetical protein H257_07482 [Aphanomyces astaci]|uniref:Uncharacterized protein n=1 Tax=Aphanomyces astaci TaxID=112090 RepID=W4GIE2_APHAT|nr:hypothetical protein H257_07482 [Aphanomyces astaci]ETV79485.1 hypothetical protein H257_07482 [Aphanomyces astaci]|eukprot:XP_009831326.1 hypothetical protein H257_07482 [Aphanomyces astaci]
MGLLAIHVPQEKPSHQPPKPPLHIQQTSPYFQPSTKLALFHYVDMGCASYQAYRMSRYLVNHRQSIFGWFLQGFVVSNIVWGFVLVAITAAYGQAPCPSTCVFSISPWFVCHCVHVDVNCARLAVDGDNATEFLRGDLLGPSVLIAEFRRCSLTSGLPSSSLASHQGLTGIFISFSQMRCWDGGLPPRRPRDLFFLRVKSSPPTRSIPDRFFQVWANVTSLSFSNLLIDDVSMEIANMLDLVWLELPGEWNCNRVADMAECVGDMQGYVKMVLMAALYVFQFLVMDRVPCRAAGGHGGGGVFRR